MDLPHGELRIAPYRAIDYTNPEDAFRPYDARFPAVAEALVHRLGAAMPQIAAEHVGSTAIPDCAGKGVIDLMIPYPVGALTELLASIEGLGFRKFLSRDPFPEQRPVCVATAEWRGKEYRVHLHLIPDGDPEIEVQRRFRDTLRADPELVEQYVASKRTSLGLAPRDSTDYNRGKNGFIKSVIGQAAN
jgi:GrpB-like predicted nucleotidyltransferase (UPF0157 family)